MVELEPATGDAAQLGRAYGCRRVPLVSHGSRLHRLADV